MLCLILIISLSLSRRDINCTSHNHQNSREEEGRTEIRPLKILNLVWGSVTSLIVLIPGALLTPNSGNKPQTYHCSPFPAIYHRNTWLYANIASPELELTILMIHYNYKSVLSGEECKHWRWSLCDHCVIRTLIMSDCFHLAPSHLSLQYRATVRYLGQMPVQSPPVGPRVPLVTWINTVTD